jgi:hypothetical protein
MSPPVRPPTRVGASAGQERALPPLLLSPACGRFRAEVETLAADEEQAPVLPPWSRLPASRSERPRTLWNTPGNAGSVIVLPGGTCWGHGGAVVAEALWE